MARDIAKPLLKIHPKKDIFKVFNAPSCKQVAIFAGFSAEMTLRIQEVRWQWPNKLVQEGQPLHRGRTIRLLTLALRNC